MDRVRVMVVDDSASTRTMLREALALDGGIEVVGEAGGGREAVQLCAVLGPDVILMDVRMPEGDGVDAARTISTDHPSTKIVALTWSDDPATVRDMLTAGAIGYVVKGGTIDELCSAIRRASSGEPELDDRVLPAAVEDLRRLLEEERGRRENIERLARARDEFVQVLSHELRTPLTVISGVLRMLQGGDVQERASLIESALRRADHLQFLVEGLELLGAAPSSADGDARPAEAVRAAADRVGSAPDAVTIEEESWSGLSQQYLERVTFELVSNAVRYGRRPINVYASTQGQDGVLLVTDQGGWGGPEGGFDAFFQEDMSATREQGGFGLGLFVASRLCQACGGDLSIRSDRGVTVAEARFRLR
jgi:DNA-binding NarL/FixJ family response regulator/anti-sigma regulatory factor (Ser/Thr protein kinase)